MFRFRVLGIAVVCVTIGVVLPVLAQESESVLPSRKVDCQDRPNGYTYDDRDDGVICGVLDVPEDWDEPAGRQIEIAFAIVESTAAQPSSEPMIFLQGGPGDAYTEAPFALLNGFTLHREERDLIIFDQRGAGLSSRLDCARYVSTEWSDYIDATYRNARDCAEGLRDEGIDIDQYNTVNSAGDVLALMQSLASARGYSGFHVYGLSYGTRLSLVMLREFPNHPLIRSVTLDSPFPTQIRQFEQIPAVFQEVLTVVFTTCAADVQCDAAYPDLKARYLALLDQANDPLRRSFMTRTDGIDTTVLVNGLRGGLDLSPVFAAYIPRLILEFENGNRDALYDVYDTVLYDVVYPETADYVYPSTINQEMYWSLQCREEIAFESESGVRASIAALEHPLLGSYTLESFERMYDICRGWNNGSADDDFKTPVQSDVPILIFQADYDMRTPPSWGRAAAESLSNTVYLSVPATGHGVIGSSPCVDQISASFMRDPAASVDTACLGGLAIKFIMPDEDIES